jgi:uncharacterized protein YcbX
VRTILSDIESPQIRGATVVELWRYPVKSMLGEKLDAVEVTRRGLLGDRLHALVEKATGRVSTAKNTRKFAQLFDFRASYVRQPNRGDSAPPVSITLPDGSTVSSDQADLEEILSKALGHHVSFESADGSAESRGPWTAVAEEGDGFSDFDLPAGTFFDDAPIHLLTTATLENLSSLHPEGRFEPRRFRPNMVIATPDAQQGFVEHEWIGRDVSVGEEVRLHITGPCTRCVMTTLAQSDLPKDVEILRTAVQHNRERVGVYASVLQGGTVRRSDHVRLD